MNFHKYKKEKKLDEIRSKHVDPNAHELTFKPNVTEFAKNMKRSVKDLYVNYNVFIF